jgi:hypothetical protein
MQQTVLDEARGQRAVVEISISSHHFIKITFISILLLAVLGCVSAYLLYVTEIRSANAIARIFLLNSEGNLPTLFTFGLLLFCSIMLLLINLEQGISGSEWRIHWRVLMIVFFLMAFDEAAMVHEKSILVLRDALGTSGWLYFAWVVPASIFVILFALAYLRFLLALPKPFTQLFILSGALYIAGVLGLEMPGGAYAEARGQDTFTFQMIATVEEVLEMAGIALFAYTLVRFLGRRQEPLRLRVRAS